VASSSSRPNHFDLNAAPKTTRDAKVWRPSFVSQNRHLTVNDFVMMNDMTVVIVARNFLTPMDEILLTGRANKIQELNTENSSLQRMLHESQQEVERLKEENKALLKLVSSYSIDTRTRLDMLQISNERILGDHERLMAKLKRHYPLPSEASRT
ncbi:unnamed protein product, partial [Prunus brigantina]